MKKVPPSRNRSKASAVRIAELAPGRALVVATVHSPGGLRLATRLRDGEVDILEFRIDALANQLDAVRQTLPRLGLPVLLTVRHPAEGGIGNLPPVARRDLFEEFLPWASLVDVELRSATGMRDVISAAKSQGTAVVLSNHHFRSTPSTGRMLGLQRAAFSAGADVFKLAALTSDVRALARLLEYAGRKSPGLRAIMGMGKFGQVSRLALAFAGSVLNYGYLDRPNAPGQWEARELKKLLLTLGA